MAIKFNHTLAGDIELSSSGAAILLIDGNVVWHAGNDGIGSGLNADQLDDLHAASFLRADASDSFTSGTLTFNSGTAVDIASGATFNFNQTTGTAPFTVDSTTVVTNLNADLLDGNQASAFYLASNPSGYTSNTGTVTSIGITQGTSITVSGSPVTTSGNITVNHADTSTLNGVQGGTGISSVTVDGLGHVTAVGTATYLTGNQTITLSGDVSGSGTTSISVTVADDSHNHIISNVDGLQTALDGKQPSDADLTAIAALAGTSGLLRKTAVNTWSLDTATYLTGNQTITLSGDVSGSGTTSISVTVADDSHNHIISNVDGLQSALDGKQALDADLTAIAALAGTSGLLRKTAANTWSLDTATYLTGNQTITLSGDVSGSGTTSISVTVADDSHNHIISNVDGLQTELDQRADFYTAFVDATAAYVAGFESDGNAYLLGGSTNTTGSTGFPASLGATWGFRPVAGANSSNWGRHFDLHKTSGDSEELYIRGRSTSDGSPRAWQRFFTDNYHPNADTLTTSRTISLTGDVTGSTGFDGSANVSITATVADDSHNHIISNVDGLQTALDGKAASSHTHPIGDITGTIDADTLGGLGLSPGNSAPSGAQVIRSHTNGYAYFGWVNTISGSAGTTAPDRVYASYDTFLRYYTPANFATVMASHFGTALAGTFQAIDADLTAIAALAGTSGLLRKTAADTWTLDTATYLTGNQTITLSGDVTGSGTTAITCTVADDSHNHIISNVDNLQTNLDGKLATNGSNAASSFSISGITTAVYGGSFVTINGTSNLALQYNSNQSMAMQLYNATGNTTGATVRKHAGSSYDVGLNVLPIETEDVSDTLEARHCGGVYFKDGTTGITLTLEASTGADFPVGGVCTIINAATSGNITVNEGTSTTLYYLNGSTRTDTAGGCTVGPGGVATLWREAATIYYIFGSGITP